MGNLCATLGRDASGRSLMLVTNAMTQPAATMPNPYGGEVRDGAPYGLPGEVVLGKGLSEQKAPLAAILLALQSILAAKVPIVGPGRVPVLRVGRDRPPRRDPQHRRGDRRARRNGDPQRHRQPHQPRQPRPRRRHRHGARQPGPLQPAASACNAVTGALEVIRRLTEGLRFSARRIRRSARPTLAVNEHPERAGFDAHHPGPLRDRYRPPADARRGPRRGGRRDRGHCHDRQRRERPGERQAVARRGDEGPVHVPVARHRVVRGRRRR